MALTNQNVLIQTTDFGHNQIINKDAI